MVYLITGAASGLGRALALLLARRRESLVLSDLDPARLDETARACREAGAEVHAFAWDVRERAALAGHLADLPEALRVPDVVVANAGLGGTNPGYAFSIDTDELIFGVNYHGMINTLMPFVGGMLARGSGSLVGICSLAGLRGLPNAGSYCASKAAQMTFLESLRVDLAPAGLRVTCVHPGFIKTAMAEHDEFPMPFMLSAERAAVLTLRAIQRGRSQVYFPRLMGWLSRFNRLLPNWLSDLIARRVAGRRDKRARVFARSA
jgi:short-subunit dehydrogenase